MARKKIEFNPVLEAEYEGLFNTSQITPNHRDTIEAVVQRVLPNKNRYQAVVQDTGVPWGALAAVHNLESSLRFDRHLHNGDPLTARTRQVPANRPPASVGNPPFNWEVSAYDAIFRHKKWGEVPEWTQGRLLYEMERYNGFGYRLAHPEVYSPYLWSMTNHYLRGKFVADGVWSPTAVSKQVGACAVFRRLLELRETVIDNSSPSLASSFTLPISISSGVTPYGSQLQKHLNTFPGVFTEVDGWPGPETSRAFYLVYGRYLKGDTQGTSSLNRLLDSQRMGNGLPVAFSKVPGTTGLAAILQDHLNTYPGIFVRVDDHPGKRTADAFFTVFGVPMLGDPSR